MIDVARKSKVRAKAGSGRVRYAVVGIGHIAQAAVLPAFEHASKNSELVALISDDPVKNQKVGRRYGVRTYSYDEYDEAMRSGKIDAVYIALPNNLHCDYAVRAARAGVHVLCEKPMAVTEEECRSMIEAADESGVFLMVAYRLHFEEANLKAVEIARSGRLGEVRFFHSAFSMNVKPGDIRLQAALGGGTVYDIGVYCINAARYVFRAEPLEVTALTESSGDPRFREVDEMAGVVLRFPGDRIATFTCSFSAAGFSTYDICGTKGKLRVEPAYSYDLELGHVLTVGGKTVKKTFKRHDQFASELLYFSNCIRKGEYPEPSGAEGLADVRIIRAIYRSAETGRTVRLEEFSRAKRPNLSQEIDRPPVKREPPLVHAQSPSVT